MDRLANVSGCELNALANSIAIYINNNFSVSDIAKLIVFFTAIADILALISIEKEKEDLE